MALRSSVLFSVLVVASACGNAARDRSQRRYDISSLPVHEWTRGLPVRGDGTITIAITPTDPTDWRTATGVIDVGCDGCTLGDDRTRVLIPELTDEGSEGVEFGHITFTTVRAHVELRQGHMLATARLRSPDVELDLEVRGTMQPTVLETALDGCVHFRPTDALRQRDYRTHSVLSLTGANLNASGWYTIEINGTLGAMRRYAKPCTLRGM